ncbi:MULTISPECIES: hypothetical protein [Shinella]|jgi:hypothetical protein|uniref:hypothetical protein n=1 Tax=Shinella TaxID=323620 RepID=UPI0010550900|nr:MULTISPECIES: hypothetical protein [Shinella]
MPVSATHDDDLIYFDLIQVTKPSTCIHFTKVCRAAPGQICVEIRRCLPETPPLFVGAIPLRLFAGTAEKGARAQSPFGEIEPVEAI